MTGLELNGFTPLLGPVSLTINSVFTSMGQIEETSDVSTGILDVQPFGPLGSTADAFFDVFVELSFGGQTYRNIAPMRLSGLIHDKPPSCTDWFESLSDVELFDEFGVPSGFWFGVFNYMPSYCLVWCV
jgi:hypothetical protein